MTSKPRAGFSSGKFQSYAFFYPAFLLVAAVLFVPLFYAVRQSVHAANYMELGPFVGLANYVNLLLHDGGLHDLGRSIIFVLGTLALTMPLGIGFAVLLNQPIRFRAFFRTVLIVPWIVSQLVTGLLWMWIYDGRMGPLTGVMRSLGLDGSALTDPQWAMPALMLTNIWHSYPLVMVFTLAALQTIPSDVIEAARIDGATAWRRFWDITLPLIRNTVLVALVLTTLHTFNTVTTVLIMTGGGPAGATEVLALRVFKEGFQFYRMEVAATAAVVIFLLNIAFSLAFVRVLKSERA
jgi:multiple sugar transport system permease protein